MTPIQLREELLVCKRSHDSVEATLANAISLTASAKVKDMIAAAAEIASDASHTALHALQEFDKSAELAKSNAQTNMEACAFSLNLCLFLFQEIQKIVPPDGESDVAINSLSSIGIRIAEAAEEAAWNAVEAMGKEADHE